MEAKVLIFLYSFLRLCLCSNVKMPKYPYQLYKKNILVPVLCFIYCFFFCFCFFLWKLQFKCTINYVLLEHATVNVLIICRVLTVSGMRANSTVNDPTASD